LHSKKGCQVFLAGQPFFMGGVKRACADTRFGVGGDVLVWSILGR